MACSDPDDDPRQLYRRLADLSRKSPRGPFRYAYTEEQFERRLSDEHTLPFFEERQSFAPLLVEQLRRDQMEELLGSLGLSSRQVHICRLRLEGFTAIQIAEELKLSERRVRGLLLELRKILLIRLKERDEGQGLNLDPYYGWQEIFINSQRR